MSFDANKFKKQVKQWIRENPDGTLNDMIDFCEEQIPANQFERYKWLLDHTADWYKHILAHRDSAKRYDREEDEGTTAS